NTPNISTSEIKNFLVRRLGEKEGEEIMDYVQSEIDKNVAARVQDAQNESALWRSELKSELSTKAEASELQEKLTKRVSAVEGTIILWGFVFWITTIIAIYVIFKFM
ncbi:MAG: hypothetical protein ABIP35_16265, partial [Ginsengibacter sp.]